MFNKKLFYKQHSVYIQSQRRHQFKALKYGIYFIIQFLFPKSKIRISNKK